MKNLISIKNSIVFLYHAIRLLLIPSKSLHSLLFVGNKLSESKLAKIAVDDLLENPAIEEQVNFNYGYSKLDLDTLKDLPKESFGYALFEFMSSQDLDVYPLLENEKPSSAIYLRERRRKIHDYLHLALGYGTDLHGEAEVNAFTARQTGMPICYLIMMGVLLKTMMKQPMEFHSLIKRLIHAWKIGGRCENLFVFQWETVLGHPLEEVRLNFKRMNVNIYA
ncbi:MAG: Coq4 family protein [Saprospiraceae bacterium]